MWRKSEGFEEGSPARDQGREGAGRGGECRLVAQAGRAGGALAPAAWPPHSEDKRPADCSWELSEGETAAVSRGLGPGGGWDGNGTRTGQVREELEGSEMGKPRSGASVPLCLTAGDPRMDLLYPRCAGSPMLPGDRSLKCKFPAFYPTRGFEDTGAVMPCIWSRDPKLLSVGST